MKTDQLINTETLTTPAGLQVKCEEYLDHAAQCVRYRVSFPNLGLIKTETPFGADYQFFATRPPAAS